MGKQKTCNHTVLHRGCASCRALKSKWYGKLADEGFHDIEYGLERPRFIAHVPDAGAPGTHQLQVYYERIWQVYHVWTANGRTRRDCRVAELLASQQGDTGTVRGISRTLKAEGLYPCGTHQVQRTIREIHTLTLCESDNKPTDSASYVEVDNAAA